MARTKTRSKNNKVYCANCAYCVLVKIPTEIAGKYVLRVRCTQNKWKKKLGDEKLYKYFTVARRTFENCGDYEPMGELKTFLRDLRKSLPIKDEVYSNDDSITTDKITY